MEQSLLLTINLRKRIVFPMLTFTFCSMFTSKTTKSGDSFYKLYLLNHEYAFDSV